MANIAKSNVRAKPTTKTLKFAGLLQGNAIVVVLCEYVVQVNEIESHHYGSFVFCGVGKRVESACVRGALGSASIMDLRAEQDREKEELMNQLKHAVTEVSFHFSRV